MSSQGQTSTSLPAAAPTCEAGGVLRSHVSQAATVVRRLLALGEREEARERFADLVDLLQRRAVRVAYQYLRDPHDADEAVQEAFLKVFLHMPSYREEFPFEVWFMRILINGCLDQRKARMRRARWVLPLESSDGIETRTAAPGQTAEEGLLARERVTAITSALDHLPERQRSVFMLKHFAGQTTAEVGHTLGLSEATVRVHLFRAVRRLRDLTAETAS